MLPPRLVPIAALVLALALPAAAHAATTTVEAESMALPSSSGMTFADSTASGGRALLIWSTGTATAKVTTTAGRRLVLRARGDQCSGAPRMVVALDGTTVLDALVPATSWTDYGADVPLANGTHTLAVSFTNDAMAGGCDRNLRVDVATVTSTAERPLAGARLWVDPDSNAHRQASAWRLSRPADAAQMDKIAAQSQADWFGGWVSDVTAAVDRRVSAAAAAGAVPTLVAYDIPQRDCGSYSAGGASSADAYKTWIRAFAAGIGDRRAIVMLEPDALAGLDCLSAADRDRRLALLRDAVAVLTAHPRVSVYLDGGHPRWQPASEMARRLAGAGVADAQGFALNVSNFVSTSENVTYGRTISAAIGNKHFVVDTSRNGLGPAPDGAWCNPPGRALGDRPGAATPPQDANLWIKRPGESDGPCAGGPAAGAWWPDYALGLAQRAAY
jgi:endoglucanase